MIDGDGSFQVNRQGGTSLEIIIGVEDLNLLRFIQNQLGGSVKIRSGSKAYLYRLHSEQHIMKVVHAINGYIRHSARLTQLHRVCQVLNIPILRAGNITKSSSWFAGFFDAEGHVTLDMKSTPPQITLKVTNKLLPDVQWYYMVFGGNLDFDSGRNGYYS